MYVFNLCNKLGDYCGKLSTLGENTSKRTIKVYFFKYCKIRNEQKKLLFVRSKNTGILGVIIPETVFCTMMGNHQISKRKRSSQDNDWCS